MTAKILSLVRERYTLQTIHWKSFPGLKKKKKRKDPSLLLYRLHRRGKQQGYSNPLEFILTVHVMIKVLLHQSI